jgi:hypothetical protein
MSPGIQEQLEGHRSRTKPSLSVEAHPAFYNLHWISYSKSWASLELEHTFFLLQFHLLSMTNNL